MEHTNEKKCPYCDSENVRDAGSRGGPAEKYIPGEDISEPDIPIYECRACQNRFFYFGE